jgi:hypothetical protein
MVAYVFSEAPCGVSVARSIATLRPRAALALAVLVVADRHRDRVSISRTGDLTAEDMT